MKRAITVLLATLIVMVTATVALAHGSAYMSGGFRIGSVIYASGTYNVSEYHSFIFASATLYRRQPGGTWSQVGYGNNSTAGRQVTASSNSVTFDCRKDYKYVIHGISGSTSNHACASSSNVRNHTC
jgi:hypothetical protein